MRHGTIPPVADASAWDARLPVNLVRLGLAVVGAGLVAIGALASADAIVRFVAANLSPDGELSARTAGQVAALRPISLAAGLIALGLAIAADWAIVLYRGLETVIIAAVALVWRFARVVAGAIWVVLCALPHAIPSRAREPIFLILLIAFVIGMALWARSVQPLFHAEGINVQPPKNLVLYGKYALRSIEGFDQDTFRITTGPAMLVPTAIAFAVFGIRFAVANAVAIAFFVFFLLLSYGALRRHYGGGAVLLGLLFFTLHPANIFYGPACGYVEGGMGEAPALAYLMMGLIFFGAAITRPSNWKLYIAGIFFGLSFQSKWLFLFSILAAIGTYGILALARRRLPSRVYLLPLLGLLTSTVAFFIMRVSQFGLQGETAHLSRLWNQHMRRAVGFSTGEGQVESLFAIARPFVTLAQMDFWSILGVFLTLPGIAYAIVLLRRRLDPVPLYLMVFTVMWFVWWILFSYDLPLQHILYIMPFLQIFTAKLVVDGWKAAERWRPAAGMAALRGCLLGALALVVIGKTAVPLLAQIDEIHRGEIEIGAPYREFVAFVDTNTEPDAIIAGWSWSKPWWLSIDRDRDIKDRSRYPVTQRESRPEYLVICPEWDLEKMGTGWPDVVYQSRWAVEENARRKKFIAEQTTLVFTTGRDRIWSLYRINPLPAAQPSATPESAATGEGGSGSE